METTHQGTIQDTILYHRQKLTKITQLSTSSLTVLGPHKADFQQQPHTEIFFPIFLTFSFSSTTSLQVLRKLDSCQTRLNPTMSQSWSPSGSWEDQSLVSLSWTPQCLKTEAQVGPEGPGSHKPQLNPTMPQNWSPSLYWGNQIPSAWTEPHNVPKPRPHGSWWPIFCQSELNPTMSQSWTPIRLGGGQSSPYLSWTPPCSKAETTWVLSAWTEPHTVLKLKPQQVLRKPESCQWPPTATGSAPAEQGVPLGGGVSGRQALHYHGQAWSRRFSGARTMVREASSSSKYCKSPLSETAWPTWSRLFKEQTELPRQKEHEL